jgi:predicted amidohydrolase YtcJ
MRLPVILAVLSLASSCFAQPADLVVTNARIWTGESSQAEASAFAVREGRFVLVGADSDVQPLIGDKTTVIDAHRKRILPGLIDTHVHLAGASAGLGRLDLRPAQSRVQFLELIGDYAKTLPLDQWVIGRGWSAESWSDPTLPTPDEIDDAAGGRPAILTRMDGHSLIAGAEAIHRAEVTNDSPADPSGGKIGRSPSGAPSGAFFDQAMSIVTSHAPSDSPERTKRLFKEAMRYANSQGLTQVGSIDSQKFIQTYVAPMDRRGKLTLRVGVSLASNDDTVEGLTPLLDWAAEHRQLTDRITILGIKGYMDGSLGSRTAWMLEPYLDDPEDPDNVGLPLSMVENGVLEKVIKLAVKRKLQPAIHAIGDRANRTLLYWYQFMGTDLWQRRPRIEHAQHLAPEDIPLLVRLGVIPNMQPLHKADDGRYAEQRLGRERLKSSYAYRTLLDSGARLAFGSDWPVVSCNPFLGIHAAVTAKTITGETFLPEQSITVAEALTCYTSNAAYALFTDLTTGMIQPGFFADFIVIDRDLLAIDPEDIAKTRVLKTFVEGQLVYDASQQVNNADRK